MGPGKDRLIFFGMIFLLSIHCGACFWVIIATMYSFEDTYDNTWAEDF